MSHQPTTCPDTDYPLSPDIAPDAQPGDTHVPTGGHLHELRIEAGVSASSAQILLDGKPWRGVTRLSVDMQAGGLVVLQVTMHARLNGRWDHLKAKTVTLTNAEPSLGVTEALREVLRTALETMSAESIAASAGGITAKSVLNFVSGETKVPRHATREAFERFVAQWDNGAVSERLHAQ